MYRTIERAGPAVFLLLLLVTLGLFGVACSGHNDTPCPVESRCGFTGNTNGVVQLCTGAPATYNDLYDCRNTRFADGEEARCCWAPPSGDRRGVHACRRRSACEAQAATTTDGGAL